MKALRQHIIPLQYLFSVACFIQASSLVNSFFLSVGKKDSWMAVLAATVVCIPIMWVYSRPMMRFPDKTLIQINEIVFGPVIGKIFSVCYLWFFFTLAALNARDVGEFVQKTTMSNTPPILVITVFVLVCALAVRQGLSATLRYSALFSLLSLFIVISTLLLSMGKMKLENFLPLFDQPLQKYFQSTHIISTIPFGELVVFLMITPALKIQPKKMLRTLLGGFVLGALSLLLIVFRDTAVLGNTVGLFTLPSFETLRLIDVVSILSRVEILFAMILMILMFFKVSFLFYVSVLALKQIFKLNAIKHVVMSMSALIVIYSIIAFRSAAEHAVSGTQSTPFIWLPFEFILPIAALVTAKIRKLPQTLQKEESAA